MHDSSFIHRCLVLAEQGRGHVGVNPLVGAVLVRGRTIIAEGFHAEFGEAHAERALLDSFHGTIAPSDVLFVNLEPCCHHGKTPPCTDLLIERGIRHVVFGMTDPNPSVSGKGIAALRAAGVSVAGPLERARCEWLNRGFISLAQKDRPWVTVRRAQTPNGRVAKPDGKPMKITNEIQDLWTHVNLRSTHDALGLGVNTTISDNPMLNTRVAQLSNNIIDQDYPSPLRIIFDPHFRIPIDAKVVTGTLAEGTWILTGEGIDQEKRDTLVQRGVRVHCLPLGSNGKFPMKDLWALLTTPTGDFHGVSSLLIEGGPLTWNVFEDAGVVDEEVVLVGGV